MDKNFFRRFCCSIKELRGLTRETLPVVEVSLSLIVLLSYSLISFRSTVVKGTILNLTVNPESDSDSTIQLQDVSH